MCLFYSVHHCCYPCTRLNILIQCKSSYVNKNVTRIAYSLVIRMMDNFIVWMGGGVSVLPPILFVIIQY